MFTEDEFGVSESTTKHHKNRFKFSDLKNVFAFDDLAMMYKSGFSKQNK